MTSPIAGETVMSRLGLGLPPSTLHSTVVFSPATLTSGTDAKIILVGLVATVTFCKIGHDETGGSKGEVASGALLSNFLKNVIKLLSTNRTQDNIFFVMQEFE